jgi:hypothetical protein
MAFLSCLILIQIGRECFHNELLFRVELNPLLRATVFPSHLYNYSTCRRVYQTASLLTYITNQIHQKLRSTMKLASVYSLLVPPRSYTYICDTVLLTHSLLEKSTLAQPLKNSPILYCARRFFTVFTRALHWSLSWARAIQFIPSHHISLRSVLILSTRLHLGLPTGSFPLAFPPISPMHSSSPPFALHPCQSHLPDLIIVIILVEEYKLWSSSLCSFLQPPVTSSLLGPDILLNTVPLHT